MESIKKYEKSFAELFEWFSSHVNLSGTETLLEFGVGRFGYGEFYNEHVNRVIGIDVEDYSKNHPDITFIQYNGRDIPLEDGSIDIIVSHSVLEHVEDFETTMRELDRVLALGGFAYLTVSPLYYSPWGSHIIDENSKRLDNWEHLDPGSNIYLTDNPLPDAETGGHSLNKLRITDLLAMVGKLPWSIEKYTPEFDEKSKPEFLLSNNVPDMDLYTRGFKLIGRKIAYFHDRNPVVLNREAKMQAWRTPEAGHAGEITVGKEIIQPLNINEGMVGKQNISIEVLMATFSRVNKGYLTISFKQNDYIMVKEIDMEHMADNQYQCLDIDSSNLKEGEATLGISSKDGSPGNAVTAYLTYNTPFGCAVINGSTIDKGLVLKLTF